MIKVEIVGCSTFDTMALVSFIDLAFNICRNESIVGQIRMDRAGKFAL
jgi:hypothetical protein